ncbi:MAG: site-specific DNA-methyltransferase [Gemmatimonadetes bacterium]|nr:MAG: site-specific DNA-methyltransferase [Gemmatimonadota bacterium]
MIHTPLPRLDCHPEIRKTLLEYCRLQPGEVWVDPLRGHRVGCGDATHAGHIRQLMGDERAQLAIHDPPYNLVAFEERPPADFIEWCRKWVQLTLKYLSDPAALYIWMGADQTDGFQPLPEFMLLMREFPELTSRSLITLRNQRGFGTPHNWMSVRQELLYYTKGKPPFTAQYTAIPKVLRGYYKTIKGRRTENLERSKSNTLRASNVWVDIQQVFYRMQENVSGCYAQKPLQATERIILASSREHERVIDFFAHAGTTLIACERLNRQCFTTDIDPVYSELTIRRLEHYRQTGLTGWQHQNPFTPLEIT